jgi:hypothetical protein
MKRIFLLLLICGFSIKANAFQVRQLDPISWPESDKDTTYYTVKGERHGISFF